MHTFKGKRLLISEDGFMPAIETAALVYETYNSASATITNRLRCRPDLKAQCRKNRPRGPIYAPIPVMVTLLRASVKVEAQQLADELESISKARWHNAAASKSNKPKVATKEVHPVFGSIQTTPEYKKLHIMNHVPTPLYQAI